MPSLFYMKMLKDLHNVVYGVVGVETPLVDSFGNKLFVGDIVAVVNKTYVEDTDFRFVCNGSCGFSIDSLVEWRHNNKYLEDFYIIRHTDWDKVVVNTTFNDISLKEYEAVKDDNFVTFEVIGEHSFFGKIIIVNVHGFFRDIIVCDKTGLVATFSFSTENSIVFKSNLINIAFDNTPDLLTFVKTSVEAYCKDLEKEAE